MAEDKNAEKLKLEASKKEKELEKNANEKEQPEKNANEKEQPEKNDKEKKQLGENDNAAEGDKVPLKTFVSRKHLKRNIHDASDPQNAEPPVRKLALVKRIAKKPTA